MPHHAEIAHHVRGRIRMKIPAAKGDECLLEQIRQALAPIPGVQEITVNPSTGSVIMLYDPDAHGDFHATLHEHGAGGHIAIRRKPPKFEVDRTVEQLEQEAEFLAEHSRVARVLVDFGRDLDQKVKWATGNAVISRCWFHWDSRSTRFCTSALRQPPRFGSLSAFLR